MGPLFCASDDADLLHLNLLSQGVDVRQAVPAPMGEVLLHQVKLPEDPELHRVVAAGKSTQGQTLLGGLLCVRVVRACCECGCGCVLVVTLPTILAYARW